MRRSKFGKEQTLINYLTTMIVKYASKISNQFLEKH